MGNRTSRVYFAVATVVFLLSYILMDSSKWTNNIFYAFIALPGLVLLLRTRGAGVFQQPLAWAWLVFLLWFVVPGVLSGSGQFGKHILYVTLFVFIIAALVDPDFLRHPLFVRGMFWSLCAYIYTCAIQSYLTGEFAFGGRVALLPARLQNIIYAGIWLLSALALALPFWLRERRWIEAGCAVVLSVAAVAFVLQTRTALVGAAFLVMAWAVYGIWRFPRVGLTCCAAGAAIMAVVLWILSNKIWFMLLIGRGDSSRIELFQVMTGEWLNCGLLMGCGLDFKSSHLLGGVEPIQHPHNIFVALGLYTGGVSLVLFLVTMAITLWQAWRLRDAWGIYLACALVMLNFDGSKLIGNPDELWPLVLLPAAAVLGRVAQQRRQPIR